MAQTPDLFCEREIKTTMISNKNTSTSFSEIKMHSTCYCILEQQYHMEEFSSVFSRQLKLLSAVRCRCLQITQLLESALIQIAPFIIRLLIGTYPDHLIHSMTYKQGWRQTGKAAIEGIPGELILMTEAFPMPALVRSFLDILFCKSNIYQ